LLSLQCHAELVSASIHFRI